jgi:hypothetical protein
LAPVALVEQLAQEIPIQQQEQLEVTLFLVQ